MKKFYDDLRKFADQELRRCKMRCLSMSEHTAKARQVRKTACRKKQSVLKSKS